MKTASQVNRHVGNLLDVERGIIVHGCNAQGAMGAGVAKAVRAKYPQAYREYRKHYEQYGLKVGQMLPVIVKQGEGGIAQIIIANAITQQFMGTDRVQVDYNSISVCFSKVAELARVHQLEVHFPLIGCGLAGGRWEEVEPRILSSLGDIAAHLWVQQ